MQSNLEKGTTLKQVTYSVLQEMDLNILSAQEKDGTALAVWVNGSGPEPGYTISQESSGIMWGPHSTPQPVAIGAMLPTDLDPSRDITLNFLAAKDGATVGDAVIWLVEAFLVGVGDLHDADTDAGGESSAMTGDAATKTVQLNTLVIVAADIPSGPCKLSLTIQPKDGTIGTDDVRLIGLWISYTKKVTTTG